MRWSDVQLDPPPKVLRQFAATWLVVLGGLGAWRGLARGQWQAGGVLVGLAAVVGVAGLIRPRLVRPIYVAAAVATFPVGWLLSWVVLGLVYFGVFTPVALAFRLIGRDPLHRRGGPPADSYWEPKPAPAEPGRYLRQY